MSKQNLVDVSISNLKNEARNTGENKNDTLVSDEIPKPPPPTKKPSNNTRIVNTRQNIISENSEKSGKLRKKRTHGRNSKGGKNQKRPLSKTGLITDLHIAKSTEK